MTNKGIKSNRKTVFCSLQHAAPSSLKVYLQKARKQPNVPTWILFFKDFKGFFYVFAFVETCTWKGPQHEPKCAATALQTC